MADIDMPDAGSSTMASSKTTDATKPSKSGGHTDGADGKKRFEVKKASPLPCYVIAYIIADLVHTVERSSSVGMGHCGR